MQAILIADEAATAIADATRRLPGLRDRSTRQLSHAFAATCITTSLGGVVAAAVADGGTSFLPTLQALSICTAACEAGQGRPQAPGVLGALLRVSLALLAVMALQDVASGVADLIDAGGGLGEAYLLQPCTLKMLAQVALVGALYAAQLEDRPPGPPHRLRRAPGTA